MILCFLDLSFFKLSGLFPSTHELARLTFLVLNGFLGPLDSFLFRMSFLQALFRPVANRALLYVCILVMSVSVVRMIMGWCMAQRCWYFRQAFMANNYCMI